MKAEDVVQCHGHPAISSRHRSTFAITRDRELTPAGDCIIGVDSDKGTADLSPSLKKILSSPGSLLITRLLCNDLSVVVRSYGSGGLSLDHPADLVWRRSTFTCGRTIGISADHAARDLPAALIGYLCGGEDLIIELTAIDGMEAKDECFRNRMAEQTDHPVM
jgi:hypothetical protein